MKTVRSATARRLAVVLVATAAVSMAGTGSASAATEDSSLLGGVTGALGTLLGGTTAEAPADPVPATAASAVDASTKTKAPALTTAVGGLTDTLVGLPLLGPVVGEVADTVGLPRSADTTAPASPAAPAPAAPTAAEPAKDTGRTERAGSPMGSTWTAPMMDNSPAAPVAGPTEGTAERSAQRGAEAPARPSGVVGLVQEVTSMLPSNAAEAVAVAGAGAATVALIVLGGIAVTGAAGAASVAGRRGLINGSVGGSL